MPDDFSSLGPELALAQTGHKQSTLSPAHARARHASYGRLKRILDILLLVLLSPVVVPLTIFIACLVLLSSDGPVFFAHRRVRGGENFFDMWKFRSMCVNSQQILEDHLRDNEAARLEWAVSHKLKDDPRVTRIGAMLRRTSLDELPQMWNVLNGSMTFVGPRPIVAAEIEKYGEDFATYCKVKPGLTGLWQISGRSSTSYERRVELDCEYATNCSLVGDLVILYRTVGTVVSCRDAY